jgi:hypothetical protein
MVTLWVDPKTYQILQYTFDDMDWDFFPGRSLVRISNVEATMQMGQAFPNVWLPGSIEMQFEMMLAIGAVDATYRVDLPELQRSGRHLQDQMKTRRATAFDGVFCVRSTIVVLALGCASLALAQTSPGIVGEVRVHGNPHHAGCRHPRHRRRRCRQTSYRSVDQGNTGQARKERTIRLVSRSASGFDRSRTPTTSC